MNLQEMNALVNDQDACNPRVQSPSELHCIIIIVLDWNATRFILPKKKKEKGFR